MTSKTHPWHVRPAADGQGYMLLVPGHGPCPVGGIYRLLPRPLRRMWWVGYWVRFHLWELTR
jgi:hypothetical protein